MQMASRGKRSRLNMDIVKGAFYALAVINRLKPSAKGNTLFISLEESSIQPYSTSLDHVPEPIQAQLSILVDLIHLSIKKHLVMVWLFGSYARGDAINDCRVDPKTGVLSEYHSDVDILVIVGGKFTIDKDKKWRQLSRNIKEHPGITASIHLIQNR